jgi:hypothetical protein
MKFMSVSNNAFCIFIIITMPLSTLENSSTLINGQGYYHYDCKEMAFSFKL